MLMYIFSKRTENMLIAGLWFGQQHPVMNTFMEPIKHMLWSLENDGTSITQLSYTYKL